jgi:hypothetical protein
MTTERGGRPTSADEDRIAIRRCEALRLRAKGKTVREIAEALDIGVATAHLDVRTAMSEVAKLAEEDLQAERGIELMRLERAMRVVEAVLGDNAEGVQTDEDGGELKLKALDRMMKLQDQRAKLLGLYAAEKVEAKIASVGLDELDALKRSTGFGCPPQNEPGS